METSSAAKEKEEGVQANNSSSTSNALDFLVSMGKEKGFEVEQNQDYGVGIIDVTWNINIHPSLPI
jgi:NAD-dependent DNA ligase